MRTRNIASAVVLIAFGLWYAYLTSHLPERTLPNTPGPSFFPWVLTVSLLILSGALLLQGFLSTDGAGASAETTKSLTRPFTGILLFFVYLLILPYLGFLVVSPFFFAGLMWTAGERRPLWIVLSSIALPAFLYLLFGKLFQILLPSGSLQG